MSKDTNISETQRASNLSNVAFVFKTVLVGLILGIGAAALTYAILYGGGNSDDRDFWDVARPALVGSGFGGLIYGLSSRFDWFK